MPDSPPNPLGPPPVDGDVSRGSSLNAIVWVFATLSICFFSLRIYSRQFVSRNLGLQDAIMAFGLVLILVESGIVSRAVSLGIARHQYYLHPPDFSNALKWQAIAEPVGIMAPCVPRIVVTMLLIKIICPTMLSIAYLWSLNILLVGISIACSVVVFVQCTPVSAQWTRMGTCWDPKILTNVSLAQGSFAAFVDFALAIFAVPTIWNLQMPLKKRIGVCFLMGLGIFAAIAAAVKTSQLTRLNAQADITWELFTLILWVMIELNVVFICACIPVLRPMWRHHFGNESSATSEPNTRGWYKPRKSDNSGYILHSRDTKRTKESNKTNNAGSSVSSILRTTESRDGGIWVSRDVEVN